LIIAGITVNEMSPEGQALVALAQASGANVVFPYEGQSHLGSILSMFGSALGFSNAGNQATTAALNASSLSASGSEVNVFAVSGGAQALDYANSSVQTANSNFQIQGVDYLSPGLIPFVGGPSPLVKGAQTDTGFTKRWHETGFKDALVNFTPPDINVANMPLGGDCGHSAQCAFSDKQPDGTLTESQFFGQIKNDLLSNSDKCPNPMVYSRKHPPHPLGGGGGGGGGGGNPGGGKIPFCSLYYWVSWTGEGYTTWASFFCSY